MLKRLKWWLIRFWGRKYFITHTDKLKRDEILIFGHRIYVNKKKGVKHGNNR